MTYTGRKRNYRKRQYNKKKLRSRNQVAKIAQQVVEHNLETKYQDQFQIAYPKTACYHNVFNQLFDNLTYTQQGVENQPGTDQAKNRTGSSIRPQKLWVKGLIQLHALASGFPITSTLVRLILVRRAPGQVVAGGKYVPSLPLGTPPHVTQLAQVSHLNDKPNYFLANIDQRQCTVVYDKVHRIRTTALTQTDVAPSYSAMGNSISQPFNINVNMNKWCRGSVDYSFNESNDPSGLTIPKKYVFQLWALPWINSDYDPAYTGEVIACSVIAQSRFYFKDA